MKWPESTATVRSSGNSASSAIDSVRGSMRPSRAGVLVRLVAPRAGGDLRGQRGVAGRRRSGTPRVEQRQRAVVGRVADDGQVDRVVGADRVRIEVDLDDLRVRGRCSAPWRVVQHVQRGAEGEHEVGLAAISRAASGEAKPPEMPSAHGSRRTGRWPIAEVASRRRARRRAPRAARARRRAPRRGRR